MITFQNESTMKKFLHITKKFLKWFFITVFSILTLGCLVILFSGKWYIFKAVACTYLVGQSGPGIQDRNFFPEREIQNAVQPRPWEEDENFGKMELNAGQQEKLENYKTTSFLVFAEDKILFEKYWENFEETTVSNSFSMAKSFVSLLIGIAIEEGKIKSVDQPVSDFVESFKEGDKSKLTLRHLLTMSASLTWSESGGNPFSDNAEAYYGSDLEGMINDIEVEGEPGKRFYYQSGATLVLGYVIEKATGKKLSDYASEKLWQPVQAEHPAFWSLDKEDGLEKSYCCWYATSRDFARIGKLMLHNGKWNDTQVVPENYVKESIAPAPLMKEDGSPNDKYGFSWWIVEHKNRKVFYARGILGQYIICIPEENIIVVRTGHKRGEKKINDHPADVFDYIDIGLEMYHNAHPGPMK